jgi:16S rRNA processing protein RimM
MTKTNDEYVIVGKIGSTYGIQGWLKIFSFTEEISNLLEFRPWFIEENQTWKEIQIKAGRKHGKGLVAQFADCINPEQARLLTGKRIAIHRSQLPALSKDEFYWKDLEGLTVINQHGETLGNVVYLIETGANDVLVIQNQGKEHAIPYLPGKVVLNIDLATGIMQVNWELI